MTSSTMDLSASELAVRATTAGGRGVWSRTGFAALGGITALALSRTSDPAIWLTSVLVWEWCATPLLLAYLSDSKATPARYLLWQTGMTGVGATLFAIFPFLLFPQHGVLGGMLAICWIAGASMHAAVFLSASARLLIAGFAPLTTAAIVLPYTHWGMAWQSALVAFGTICALSVAIAYTVQGNQFLAEISRRLASRSAAARTARAREQILAILTHELRTPVHAIDGYSGLMLDDVTTGSIHADDLAKLKTASEHLVKLVDRASEIVRLETGLVTLDNAPVSLGGLLEAAQRRWSAIAATRGVTLQIDKSVAAIVNVDERKLSTALDCLLENAIAFSSQRGVRLAARIREDVLTIVICNTGTGFDAETADRIFEVFEQGDMSSTRTHEGAGLGLALAQRLANAMGGDVDAISRLGAGSTFRLSVLLAQRRQSESDELAAGEPSWEITQSRQALEAAIDAVDQGNHRDAQDWIEEAAHYMRKCAIRRPS